MYPYNTPGAFVPHSAINLSVKSNETPVPTSIVSSLDLSVTEANSANSNTNTTGSTGGNSANSYLTTADPSTYATTTTSVANNVATKGSSQNAVPSPQILDLTRPVIR